MNRRDFMKTSMAGAAAIAIPSGMQAHAAPLELPAAEEKSGKNSTIKKEVDDDKFKISMAGYTFVKFDIDTTLAFLKKLAVHYLCIKDFHLPLDSNEQKIAEFKAKLKAADVTGYGVGPIYMKNEQEVDRAFAYAYPDTSMTRRCPTTTSSIMLRKRFRNTTSEWPSTCMDPT